MDLKLEQLQIDAGAVSQQLEVFIKASVSNFKREGVIVGASGGLDSSVVLALSVAALGPDLILLGLDKNMGTEAIVRTGIKAETVEYVRELIKKSEHMRGLPATPD